MQKTYLFTTDKPVKFKNESFLRVAKNKTKTKTCESKIMKTSQIRQFVVVITKFLENYTTYSLH